MPSTSLNSPLVLQAADVADPVEATPAGADAFDRCKRGLYRYFVVRTGGDAHAADDLMQQLWMACNGRTPASAADAEPWMQGVARNLIRAFWRRRLRRPREAPVADPTTAAALADRLTREELPAEALSHREVRDQLLLAITSLDSDEQELLIEHYFHDESHARLAERLGVGVRAVEGRLYRARQSLRARLQNLEP